MASYIECFAKKSRISCWCGVLYIWTYIPRKSVSFLYWIGSIPSICVITERFLAYVTKEACKLHLVSRAVIFFSYLHIQKAKQVRSIALSNVIFCQKTKNSEFVSVLKKIKHERWQRFSFFLDKNWTNNLKIRKTLIYELEDTDSKVCTTYYYLWAKIVSTVHVLYLNFKTIFRNAGLAFLLFRAFCFCNCNNISYTLQ